MIRFSRCVVRFRQEKIYSYVGEMLLAMNPYQVMRILSADRAVSYDDIWPLIRVSLPRAVSQIMKQCDLSLTTLKVKDYL